MMFMLIAASHLQEEKKALLDCPFSLPCFLHRLCSVHLLKRKCVFKVRTLFISSKTWSSFRRTDKHEKLDLVLVFQDLQTLTAYSLEISVPEE